MTETESEGQHRLTRYKIMIVALTVMLVTVTLVSYVEIQSLQNRVNSLELTGYSVVSGKVTTSTDKLANVPYAATIMFGPGFGYFVNSTITLQSYITYLTDGLGYDVIIQFSNKTLCHVGTFVPMGIFVTHDFSC